MATSTRSTVSGQSCGPAPTAPRSPSPEASSLSKAEGARSNPGPFFYVQTCRPRAVARGPVNEVCSVDSHTGGLSCSSNEENFHTSTPLESSSGLARNPGGVLGSDAQPSLSDGFDRIPDVAPPSAFRRQAHCGYYRASTLLLYR